MHNKNLSISIHLTTLALAVSVGALVAHLNQSNLEQKLATILDEKHGEIVLLAEITDRNGADTVTESILSDCRRRSTYESHLERLATLTKEELIIMQSLFESCSPFYVTRKALMVSRLEQEIQGYREFINLYAELKNPFVYEQLYTNFASLLEVEKIRSDLLYEQTEIQSQIILLLISGNLPQSPNVQAQVQEAQRLNELIGTYKREADIFRNKLVR